MTQTGTAPAATLSSYSGIAAADALDALLTAGDFEPAIDVDTDALDATEDALLAARALVASLATLRAHLANAGDPDTALGLEVDARVALENVEEILAGRIA